MSDAKTAAMEKLEEISTKLDALTALVAALGKAAPRAAASGSGELTLPNYGRSKGMPIAGASMQDLEFYANGSRRSIADPAKAQWSDKEKRLLAALEAEIARQSGGYVPTEPPPHTDADQIPF